MAAGNTPAVICLQFPGGLFLADVVHYPILCRGGCLHRPPYNKTTTNKRGVPYVYRCNV